MDCWNTPLMAEGEWWGEVPCEEMLVLYGEDELFRDDIDEFCAKLKVCLRLAMGLVLTLSRQIMQRPRR